MNDQELAYKLNDIYTCSRSGYAWLDVAQKARELLQPSQWIPTAERLPTAVEADYCGCVLGLNYHDRNGHYVKSVQYTLVTKESCFTYWLSIPPRPKSEFKLKPGSWWVVEVSTTHGNLTTVVCISPSGDTICAGGVPCGSSLLAVKHWIREIKLED